MPKTKRAWQLQILTDMDLPKAERSRDDRPVKAVELAAVLKAIDNRAREDGWYFRSRGELKRESKLDSLRQLDRCIDVLKRKGWIESRHVTQPNGTRLCHLRIVFQDLCRLTTLSLWVDVPKPIAQVAEPVAQTRGPVARVAEPVAHAGNTRSAPINDPLINEHKAPSEMKRDGARIFTPEELDEIDNHVCSIQQYTQAESEEDQILILKIATLRHDGKISEDAFQQVIEAFCVHKTSIKKPMGYLWSAMTNQCEKCGGRTFQYLLKNTDYPRELLDVPVSADVSHLPVPTITAPSREGLRTQIILQYRLHGHDAVNLELARHGFPESEFV